MGERLQDIAAKSIHLKSRPDFNNTGDIKDLFKVDGVEVFVKRTDRLYLNPSLILGSTGTSGGTISATNVITRGLSVSGDAKITGNLTAPRIEASSLISAPRAEITNMVATNLYGNGTGISALSSLNIHSDVDLVTDLPGLGHVLTWDTSVGKWTPKPPSIGSLNIGDLRNVDTTTTTPTIGQSLIWDGGNFVPGRNTLLTISDHSDVDTTTIQPVTGDALLWNGVNWVPGSTVLTNTDKAIGELTDVDTLSTPPVDGDALVYDATSSAWIPKVPFVMGGMDTLTDVDVTTNVPATGEILKYNGTNFVPTTNEFYISSTGNVGIGSNSPTEALDVVGNIKLSGTVAAASDRRLKTNIDIIPNALELVKKLNGVRFDMKVDDENERMVGVIAQDIREVLPEVVREFSDGTFGVQYQNIVAPLIEAIKELAKKVEALERK